MVQLVYALFIAVAAFGVTNALFQTTWLNILVTVIALLIFFLALAGKYIISFLTIGAASLFGEKKSLKEISDEAFGDVLDDDIFDSDDDDD